MQIINSFENNKHMTFGDAQKNIVLMIDKIIPHSSGMPDFVLKPMLAEKDEKLNAIIDNKKYLISRLKSATI